MSFRTRRKYRGRVSVLTLLGRLTTIARDLSTFCKVKLMFNYIGLEKSNIIIKGQSNEI